MSLTPEQFENRMRKAGPRMLKSLKKEFVKIGLRMEAEAKKNATYYPRVVTGRLRSSINSKVTISEGSPQIILRAGGSNQVNYARAIEFGTDRIEPRLFMGSAVQTILRRVEPGIFRVIKLSLEEADAF